MAKRKTLVDSFLRWAGLDGNSRIDQRMRQFAKLATEAPRPRTLVGEIELAEAETMLAALKAKP